MLRLLERGDKRNYQKWLNQQQSEGTITQNQMAVKWSSFLSLPMEAKRQRANQAREALGRQVVPWNFGTPPTVSNAGVHAQACAQARTRANTHAQVPAGVQRLGVRNVRRHRRVHRQLRPVPPPQHPASRRSGQKPPLAENKTANDKCRTATRGPQ